MKKCNTSFVFKEKHIDDLGHVGLDVQGALLKLSVITAQASFGLDLKSLKDKPGCDGCRFAVTEINKVRFVDELFLGDEIKIKMLVWISGKYNLEFFVRYFKGDVLKTEGFCTAHLIRFKTDTNPKASLVPLPDSIIQIIGTGVPSDEDLKRLVPTS